MPSSISRLLSRSDRSATGLSMSASSGMPISNVMCSVTFVCPVSSAVTRHSPSKVSMSPATWWNSITIASGSSRSNSSHSRMEPLSRTDHALRRARGSTPSTIFTQRTLSIKSGYRSMSVTTCHTLAAGAWMSSSSATSGILALLLGPFLGQEALLADEFGEFQPVPRERERREVPVRHERVGHVAEQRAHVGNELLAALDEFGGRYLPAGPDQRLALAAERVVADPVERPRRPHPGRRDRPVVVEHQVQHDRAALPDHAGVAVHQAVLALGDRALQVLQQRGDRQADPPDRVAATPRVPPGVDVDGLHALSPAIVRSDTGTPRAQPSLARPRSYRPK